MNPLYYEARAKIGHKYYFYNNLSQDKILDYGCGMGQNIYHLKNAQGYDISKKAKDFCLSKGLQVTTQLETIPNDSFDIVFSSHVLEHHPHPKTMLEEMHMKLKSNGELRLVLPYETHGKSTFYLDAHQHLYTWNFRTINNLLVTSGFRIKENKYLRGAGYEKFLFLYKINFNTYEFATKLISYCAGIKDMLIIAEKI
jgi:ubiquinone/menaquinone biosynthesis C-methylase UbiE